ncbi:hypothetical protein [Mycetocola spongiae]|uniref:hypothetical protein n=1 Tax=Mycetocola spongiae TaxID=2859226 RepID=UPI001CF56AA8|nr:hypothetical protein [Mycetocola spongiae]UCR88426.1 hypothetical protein KXZ72_10685 [Mycetocola spongiae]
MSHSKSSPHRGARLAHALRPLGDLARSRAGRALAWVLLPGSALIAGYAIYYLGLVIPREPVAPGLLPLTPLGDPRITASVYVLGGGLGVAGAVLAGALAATTEATGPDARAAAARRVRATALPRRLAAGALAGAAAAVLMLLGAGFGAVVVQVVIGQPLLLGIPHTWGILARCAAVLTLWGVAGAALAVILRSRRTASLLILLGGAVDLGLRAAALMHPALAPLARRLPSSLSDAAAGVVGIAGRPGAVSTLLPGPVAAAWILGITVLMVGIAALFRGRTRV